MTHDVYSMVYTVLVRGGDRMSASGKDCVRVLSISAADALSGDPSAAVRLLCEREYGPGRLEKTTVGGQGYDYVYEPAGWLRAMIRDVVVEVMMEKVVV